MCVYVYVKQASSSKQHIRRICWGEKRERERKRATWFRQAANDNLRFFSFHRTVHNAQINGNGSDDWHLLAHQLDRTNLTKAYTSRRQRSPSFCALAGTGPVRRWNDPPRGWRDCSTSPRGPRPPSSRSSADRSHRNKIRRTTRSRPRRLPSRYQLCPLVWSTFSTR